MPAASISVVDEETGLRRTTHSQMSGVYAVASLRPGTYKITVRKQGFRTLIRFGIELVAAQPTQMDFDLPLGSMQEVITVQGSPPLLNSESISVGTLIRRETIDALPLNGRGLLSLLDLAPGVITTPATRGEAGQFTASGQRPNANYFTLDGVSVNTGVSGGGLPAQCTGGSLPGMTALGSLHGLVSLEALDEFRIETSSTAPESGTLPGARVELSTRSGTNRFHGSLFHYFRDEHLDANGWFANRAGESRAPLNMHDLGASLGGPLKRNRSFFFASYEGMRLRGPFAWRAPVPTADARNDAPEWARPVLGLLPLPNGRWLGPNTAEWAGSNYRRSQFDVAGLRLDHALTPRLTAFARLNYAPSSNQFTGTQVNDLEMRSRSITVGMNLRLNTAAILDLKANVSDAKVESFWKATESAGDSSCFIGPVTEFFARAEGLCNHLLRFSISGIGQAMWGREADQRQTQWQVLPSAVLVLGSHQLRIGLDQRRFSPTRRDNNGSISVVAEDLDDLLKSQNLWVSVAAPRTLRSVMEEMAAYAQDTWRVHPRLTATIGLRWEYSRPPQLTQGTFYQSEEDWQHSGAYIFPAQSEIWKRRYTNFAPRFGVAFQPLAGGAMVLRAGGGLFYDSSLSIATDLVNGGPFSVAQYGNPKHAPFSTIMSYGFLPDLRLPAIYQWNFTVEQRLPGRNLVSAGYVGAAGHHLLRREFGSTGTGETLWLALATNRGQSRYHALQAQYRRPMARGLEALASYSWSHSIDNSSSDALLHRAGLNLSAAGDRGSSDFDARHTFTAGLTYETGSKSGDTLWTRVWSGWEIDGILRARSAFPITVLNSEYSMGLSFANAFRPNLVGGQPVWIRDPSAPGGRRLNRDTFQLTDVSIQGSLGRNAIRGFGMYQIDTAVRRQFQLGERWSLQLRAEAFNVLNHPNFSDPAPHLSNPLFGESASMLNLMLGTGSPGSGLTPVFQTGGARSMQIALRLRF